MSSSYEPTEEQIAALLAKFTPRQIAIAYLRAKRRAREAEASFEIMDKLASAAVGLAAGDGVGAINSLERSVRHARAYRQVTEPQA